MSTTVLLESGLVVNRAEPSETFQDLLDYIFLHIDEWRERHVLWDLRLFDFTKIYTETIEHIIERVRVITQKRSGMKTALLVSSDLGFGMMRMLEMLAEDLIEIKLHVFRDEQRALDWLLADPESSISSPPGPASRPHPEAEGST